jgi:hypothetical protein
MKHSQQSDAVGGMMEDPSCLNVDYGMYWLLAPCRQRSSATDKVCAKPYQSAN